MKSGGRSYTKNILVQTKDSLVSLKKGPHWKISDTFLRKHFCSTETLNTGILTLWVHYRHL